MFFWIKLIALAAFMVALAAAVHHVIERFRDEGRTEVRKEWSALMKVCTDMKGTPEACALRWQEAETKNQTLQADVEKMRAAAAGQNAAVDDWKHQADAAQANARKAQQELAQQRQESTNYIAALEMKARAPATTRTEECDEADAISRATAERRVRYFGRTPAGSESRDGHDQGAGTGALRISH